MADRSGTAAEREADRGRSSLQAELAQRERQLAEAQRLAHVGSWEWDVRADAITWSDELYRIYGREPGSPIGLDTFLEAVHPDDRTMVREVIAAALGSGEAIDFQHRIVRPDGAVRWLHGRGEVELGHDGSPVRMAGTGHDITELREAEEKTRRLAVERAEREIAEEAERRMSFLARCSVELASSLDHETTLATIARLAVPDIADWCAVDLLEPDGGIRRLAVEHQDPTRVEAVRQIERRYPPDPDAAHGVPRVIRTGRSELGVEVTDELLADVARDETHLALLRDLGLNSFIIAPLAVRNRVLGALTVVHAESGRRYGEEDRELVEDLAGRAAIAIENARLVRDLEEAQDHLRDQAVELEEQAETLQAQNEELQAQAAELERAVRSKDEFVATMSHELRTPLNAIIGYTDLLKEGIPVPIPEPSQQHARRITLAARHLMELINEILTFSRLEADRETVVQEPLQIEDLLDEIQAVMRPLAEEKGLEFRIRGENVPDRMKTDPSKVRQVLLNLLGNAVKFTDRGSVELLVRGETAAIVFRVMDSGPGIAEEDRHHLFEPFWQGDQSRTRQLGGTGLGLAISDRFVRLLGGSVSVESEPGRGSTFTLRLPLERG